MSMPELSPEDEADIIAILKAERDRGTEGPLLPMDFDVDGDGIVDAFGLDEEDNLIVVSSVPLADTVFESSGDDVNNSHPDLEWLETDMGDADG